MVERFRDVRVYRGASLPHGVSTSIRRTGESGAVCADSLDPTLLRAVNANSSEAWRKRLYSKYFVSKLSDADAEAAETRSWLDFALDHGYIAEDFYDEVDDRYDKIQGRLVKMISNPDRWCSLADAVREEHTGYFTSGPFPK